jgi:phosphohistidine phosphatase SixA
MSHPHTPDITRRRLLSAALLGTPWPALARDDEAARLLRAGGVVVAFRHALAPGVYDPPGMRIDDCSTQRNLDDTGRAQAKNIGAWFAGQGLKPGAVLSSPWCRCLDTARGAFGRAEAWLPLGSPTGRAEGDRSAQVLALSAALARPRAGRFDVWVTHNFVIADLTGISTASGEGVLLRAGTVGPAQVLARLTPP